MSDYPWETGDGSYYEGAGGMVAWYAHRLPRAYAEQAAKGQLRQVSANEGRTKVRMRQRRQPQPVTTAVGHEAPEEANAQIEELRAQLQALTSGQGDETDPAGASDPPVTSFVTVDRPTQRDDKALWVRYGVARKKGTEEELDAMTKADLVTLLS